MSHLAEIDDGVDEPGRGEGPEEVDGRGLLRPGHQVEGGVGQEEVDVLHVVLVRPPDALHLLARRHPTLPELGVLRVGVALREGKMNATVRSKYL